MHRYVFTLLIAVVLIVGIFQCFSEAQCTKDLDCKGTRICRNGSCEDPEPEMVNLCSLAGTMPKSFTPGVAENEAQELLNKIGAWANLSNMPRIVTGPVPNASAVIYGKERLIVYRHGFIAELRERSGTDWSVRFVFAHELGHHVEGHTVEATGSNHEIEYQADKWAVLTIKKMGAGLDDALAALRAMPAPASSTHPSSHDRIAKAKQAYENDGTRPPSPQKSEPSPQTQLLPSGTLTIPCGCHGFAIPGAQRPNSYCESGMEVAVPCDGFCMMGGQPWTLVCR